MNYFFDTEFHEGFIKPWFGKKRHVIDFISIGIVSEDNREYYAVCSEFDVERAWNAWQPGEGQLVDFGRDKIYPRVYWLRENVLFKIWKDLAEQLLHEFYDSKYYQIYYTQAGSVFSLAALKYLVKRYGKTKKQIADDIYHFVNPHLPQSDENRDTTHVFFNNISNWDDYRKQHNLEKNGGYNAYTWYAQPKFYAYFADYDWVVFCSLFGKMIDLPKGFPWYCRDIKQQMDLLAESYVTKGVGTHTGNDKKYASNIKDGLEWIKNKVDYPVNNNEHNALSDARFDRSLFSVLLVLERSGFYSLTDKKK